MAVGKRKYSGTQRTTYFKKKKYGRASSYRPTVPSVKALNMPEQKFIDVNTLSSANLFDASTTGLVTLLNGVPVGDDFTDRTGRKILMKSLSIKSFVSPQGATSVDQLARILIVYDKQTNGATPAIGDILRISAPGTFGTDHKNLNNRDRFVILCDQTFEIGYSDTTATVAVAHSPTIQKFNKYIKLDLPVTFGNTTAGIASITTGGLFMVTCGTAATGGASDFNLGARVMFTDA